jgi:hypothetical protein
MKIYVFFLILLFISRIITSNSTAASSDNDRNITDMSTKRKITKEDIEKIKQLDFNMKGKKYNYQILYNDNSLDEDTLVTIIASLLMVLFFGILILAVAKH